MAIRPGKLTSVPDTGDTSKVQPSDLNPSVVPASPAQSDIISEETGTSPNRFIRLKVYDNGAWRVIAEYQY